MDKVIACITAKGHSTRLPNKNILTLGDKPLFCHILETALKCKLIDKVVIDSDSEIILAKGAQLGAENLKRPNWLATNDADGNDLVYWEASNYPDSEIIVQLAPTAPFIKSASIHKAILMMQERDVDSVHGMVYENIYEWINYRPNYLIEGRIPNSFDKNMLAKEVMGLCVIKTKYALNYKRRINPNNCLSCFLSKIEAIDINTEEDFKFAEIIWKGINK